MEILFLLVLTVSILLFCYNLFHSVEIFNPITKEQLYAERYPTRKLSKEWLIAKRLQADFEKGIRKLFKKKAEEIEEKLIRANIDGFKSEFFIFQLVFSFLIPILMGLFLAIIFRKTLSISFTCLVLGIFIGTILYFDKMLELDKGIEARNRRILGELPRFIKTIEYSPRTKSVTEIIRDYLQQSSGLKYDLELYMVDIETGLTEKESLQRWAGRISLSEIKDLSDVLQNLSEANLFNLIFIEARVRDKINKLVEADLSKRPEKLELINFILMQSLVLLLLAPMLLDIFKNIQQILG